MRYLYLISCDRYFKIGVTDNVPERLAKLYTGNPFEMEVSLVYVFDSSEPIERSLHQRFQNSKVRGEWFALTEEEVDIFKQICELLGGVHVYYEEAIPVTVVTEEEWSKSETWRTARKSMSDQEVLKISRSSLEELMAIYSLSERTAWNWKSYARKELNLD